MEGDQERVRVKVELASLWSMEEESSFRRIGGVVTSLGASFGLFAIAATGC